MHEHNQLKGAVRVKMAPRRIRDQPLIATDGLMHYISYHLFIEESDGKGEENQEGEA